MYILLNFHLIPAGIITVSCDLTHSHQRCAAGSQPAGWAAGSSRTGSRGYSVGTGRRCPAAAPGTGCCRTSLRSQTLCCPLAVGGLSCRQVRPPSVSEELKRKRQRRWKSNSVSDKFKLRKPTRFHVLMIYTNDLIYVDSICPE